jgi:Tfp pilus assembly protein PilV
MSAILRRRRRRRNAAGYTLVELMLAFALLIVGVLGIVSMQKAVIVTNAHAKNLSGAERIAQTWATQLQMDSNSWRVGFNAAGVLQAPTTGAWQRPSYKTGRVGGAFDAKGVPLTDSAADLARARYCVNTRLSWLYNNNTGVAGNGVVRAEIRVYWLREGQSVLKPEDGLCATNPDVATMIAIGQATSQYHFIYHTVGIRQRFQI